MIDLVTLQIVRDLVAIFGVLAGFSYYVIIVRNSQRMQKMSLEARQAALYMQYTDSAQSLDIIKSLIKVISLQEWEDYDDWDRKYGSKVDIDHAASFIHICRFYSRLGTIYELNMIDPDIIHIELGRGTIRAWEKLSPLIIERRKRANNPVLFQKFEYLYNEMKKREQEEITS